MFAKDKVSQSMLDAVKKVIENESIEEATSEKVPTSTGMKVYGHRYGNSKKAREDQTKSSVDDLKGPKDKEVKEEQEFTLEAASYADLHKKYGKTHNIEYHSKTVWPKQTVTKFDNEKDAEAHAKKTGGTVSMRVGSKLKEELKGNQDKIDKNHNNKIDAQDFAILRAKKKVKEERSFTDKLLESVRRSDVPAFLRKAKGEKPLTPAEVKAPRKDSISSKEALAKANEEVELTESDLHGMAYKHGWQHKQNTYGAELHHPKHGSIGIDRYGHWYHHDAETKATGKVKAHGEYDTLEKHLSSMKEEVELDEKLDAKAKTLDTLLGRKKVPATYDNEHTSPKVKLEAEEVEHIEERDEGKPGLMFKKIAAKAAARYGSKAAGNRVAGAIRKKVLAKEEIEELSEEQLDEMINEVLGKDATAGDWIHDFIHSKNPKFAGKSKAERKKMALGAYYGKQNEETISEKKDVAPGQDDAPFDPPYTTGKPKNVKDKSGAVHTPMSRAKDLARQAFKKLKNETMMGKAGTTSESKKKW